MRVLGYLAVACIVFALLKAALAVLLVALIVGITVGLVMRPAETVGVIAFWALVGLFEAHPWAAVALVVMSAATIRYL